MIRILIFIACLVWALANEEVPFKCRHVERVPGDKFADYDYDCVPTSEEDIRGEKGERGDTGAQGPIGPAGPKGDPGERGADGAQGSAGSPGEKGSIGLIGPKGNDGLPGVAGSNGSKGEPGENGIHGRDGVSGKSGIPGLDGMNGNPGLPGVDGFNGAKGEPGEPGSNGERGVKGMRGLSGSRGEKGSSGLQGVIGEPGVPGIPGNPGEPGVKGTKGAVGFPGLPGQKGEVGEAGLPGKSENLDRFRRELVEQISESEQRMDTKLQTFVDSVQGCLCNATDKSSEEELEDLREKLHAQNETAQEQLAALQNEVEYLSERLAQSETESAEKSGDLDQLREEFETYTTETEAAKRQSEENIERLTDELVQARTETNICISKIEELKTAHDTEFVLVNASLQECKSQLEASRDAVQECQTELAEVKDLHDTCERQSGENSDLNAILRKMTLKEAHMRDRISRQKQKIFDLIDSLTIANATIEACRQNNGGTSQVPEDTVTQLREQLQAGNDQLDCLCDVRYDGKCYWLETTENRNTDFDKARAMCGCGTPANIISQQLYDELSAHVRSSVFVKRQNAIDLWLGMTYDTVTEEIRNSDGTLASFVSWWLYGGYPLSKRPHSQLALNVNRNATVQGMWNTMPEHYGLRGVICQK